MKRRNNKEIRRVQENVTINSDILTIYNSSSETMEKQDGNGP